MKAVLKRIDTKVARLCAVGVLLTCSLLMTLVACTGSSEAGVPTLLVVAYGATEGKLALIEDTFFGAGVDTARFVFIKELDLSGTVLDYDIVDRLGDRSTLVVLSEDASGRAALSLVNLAGIDPETGATAFRVTRTVVLDSVVNAPELAPVQLEVSKTGRYVALLNDFSPSDDRDGSVTVLDLQASGGPAFLDPERPLNNSVYDGVLFLNQAENPERIYFLSVQASGQQLRYATLPSLTLSEPDITVPQSTSSTGATRALGLVGDNTLVALQDAQFTPIVLRPNLQLGTAVSTRANAQRIVPNNSSAVESLIVINSSEVSLHRTLEAAADTQSIRLLDGSLEPFGGFIYFVQDSSAPLVTFDFQLYDRNEALGDSLSFAPATVLATADSPGVFKDLPNPVFVTWIKAVPAAAP